ncbi:MAG: alanine--tRNA ligase [Bacillota bacterium]|nr:alanine--tRNA ligase [Bacillota bacterium]
MKSYGLNELREKYLSFFESKQHLRLGSFPLIPKDDNSLLLINSGMAPMKKYFTGEIKPPRKRVTTCQKCIRTPDIENVGITARHGTFFEMLGNFSFGDYFKNEATAWAWEFFTKVLEIPEDILYVSIYEEDNEAYEIWTKKVGVKEDHMVRLGKADNFWEHGAGPCGPCSEIYFDRGPDKGCGSPNCAVGCDCDRFVEVWNLVFTQFNSDGNGNYTPLDHPNIDTGMGLERLACVMQKVDNLFLVDTVQNIMKHISKLTNVAYGISDKQDISLRVITDHIRSTTFMIADGVMPSNEGRGYVLRRLLRRAARHGRLLGVTEPFLYKVCETVIKENSAAYPELVEKKEFIIKLIKIEEENFSKTISDGLVLIDKLLADDSVKEISGADAFKLNDTFGFPIDLLKEIVAEKGKTVDEDGFRKHLQEQKTRSRNARENAGAEAWISDSCDLSDIHETTFVGYTSLSCQSKVTAIIKDGERVDLASGGDEIVLVLEKSPFYALSGGQVGDTGKITSETCEVSVLGTNKNHSGIYMHNAEVENGIISVGDIIEASVDEDRRHAIMRNHTGAHLLQAALRKELGTHVEQAGQLVDSHRIRFDFTHFSALTHDELKNVEQQINSAIMDALPVVTQEMPIEEAKKLGAMALFGEKYGDVVRVVTVPEISMEFCGGTHVDSTAKLGLFKITSESSVAAGVRRIEGVTGWGVLNALNESLATINGAAEAIKLNNPSELVRGCSQLFSDYKEKDKIIAELNGKLAGSQVQELLENAKEIKSVKVIASVLKNTNADMLRNICDRITDKEQNAVTVLAGISDGKITIACACGKEAQKAGAHAGKIVKEVAIIAGGNGGGKPDMAMAGAKDVNKIDEAINKATDIISGIIN